MKTLVTLFVVVSVLGVWACDFDKEEAGSDAWIEILSVDPSGMTLDCSEPRDQMANFLMQFHPDTDRELWAHLTRIRVSSFRTDGGSNVPGTFDQDVDHYLAPEESITFSFIIVHEGQFYDPPIVWLCNLGYDPDTGEQMITGYFIIQFWGETSSGGSIHTDLCIPMQIADWGGDR